MDGQFPVVCFLGEPVMTKSRRPLGLESLESRRLMHADVSLGKNGILLIEADPAGGTVQVSSLWGRLLVNSRTEEGSQTNSFSRTAVKQVVFRGSEKDDVFANRPREDAARAPPICRDGPATCPGEWRCGTNRTFSDERRHDARDCCGDDPDLNRFTAAPMSSYSN